METSSVIKIIKQLTMIVNGGWYKLVHAKIKCWGGEDKFFNVNREYSEKYQNSLCNKINY